MKKNILILYTNSSTGYYMGAKAIEEKIKKIYPQSNILVLDPLEYSRPILNNIINLINNFLDRKFKTIKNKIDSNKIQKNYLEESLIYSLFSLVFWTLKLERKINEFNPSIIFSNNPEVSILLAKHRHVLNSKLVSILTDYTVTNSFIVPYQFVDLFFVPSQLNKDNLIKYGIDENKINVTGIPVRGQFTELEYERTETLKKHYMSLKKPLFLFVIGNGYKSEKMLNYFEELLKSNYSFSYILVPGSNNNIEKRAKRIAIKYNKPGKILGYTNNMAELIEASDIVVSQPGGLIISECLELNRPFCSIEPTSSREVNNAVFLSKNNFGFNIKNMNSFKLFIRKIGNETIDFNLYKKSIKEKHIKKEFDNFIKNFEF